MPLILLTKGKAAIVDKRDFQRLNRFNWYATPPNSVGTQYAFRTVVEYGQTRRILMHREITQCSCILEVDHKNGDGLDNRRKNLRVATRKQNAQNTRISRLNTSGFKGVNFDITKGKWEARVNTPTRRLRLGYFDDPEKAADAFRKAALVHYGEFARLN